MKNFISGNKQTPMKIVTIPIKFIELKKIMDELIEKPDVPLKNATITRQLGQYVEPITHCNPPILKIYNNRLWGDSIGKLVVKNVKVKMNGKTKRWEYIFNADF